VPPVGPASDGVSDALEAVAAFVLADGAGLTTRIRVIEAALAAVDGGSAAQFSDTAEATDDLLRGALLVKRMAGQINLVIHAVGILRALPYVLEPEETVISASLGAGNTGRDWDLETDRQVAEFKFITWQGGAEAIRQNSLFVDVFHLAEAATERRKVMYVTGAATPRRFLERSNRALTSVLSHHSPVEADFRARHGDHYRTVREYWADVRDQVELVDLATVMPWPVPEGGVP
jgi:hypothetical protein